MNKSILLVLSAFLLFLSCQKNALIDSEANDSGLFVHVEQDEVVRTGLDENNNVLWSEGDLLVAFMKSTLGLKYKIDDSYVGKNYGYFYKVPSASSGDIFAGMELKHNVAYYPYSETVECIKYGNDYAVYVVLPAEQTYDVESFADNAFPMVAVSDDDDIDFCNVCGGMKILLKGTSKISSVKVEGKNNEKLSGSAVVVAYVDDTKPNITMDPDAATYAILNCADIQLNETTATEFIITLPPTVFTKGFVVTVTDSEGNIQIIETDKSNEVKRSSLLVMPEVTLEPQDNAVNLSYSGTANCYIVSETGLYKFTPTKGSSDENVGEIYSVDVLWESFGTTVIPNVGDLLKNIVYKNDFIYFDTSSSFQVGNAVIAAMDENGNILWSWHIWFTDKPDEQEYYNNAGIVMDRNLGATSAAPGNVGTLGLFYQWGRKDPFLGSSSISSNTIAKSTISWPNRVISDSSFGTIAYATQNPTTFVKYYSGGYDYSEDWCYISNEELWTPSGSQKSIYDPCPPGWRVPDGGSDGLWTTALGSNTYSDLDDCYDNVNRGYNFSGMFGNSSSIWYPATGYVFYNTSSGKPAINDVGTRSYIWSATTYSTYTKRYAYYLGFDRYDVVSSYAGRGNGYSVRCVQE